MKRKHKDEIEEPGTERNRNYREWLEVIALVYILVASSFWLGRFLSRTRFCTDPLSGQTMIQKP